jgi:hypothetical protein
LLLQLLCFAEFNYNGPRKLYNSLPDLYARSPASSALSSTIVALGIASMSSSMKIPSLMMKANAKYAEALNLVNSAVRDPTAAKLDDTLMVVILLGLYEEVCVPVYGLTAKARLTLDQNNPTTISLDPWTHHVKGALILLDYRGQSQLQEPQGIALIRAQRMQMVSPPLDTWYPTKAHGNSWSIAL